VLLPIECDPSSRIPTICPGLFHDIQVLEPAEGSMP
jgi:hypothetical protein